MDTTPSPTSIIHSEEERDLGYYAPTPKNEVVIDFKTAEYLAVLIGQTNWGDQERRANAAAALSASLGTRKLTTSQECFGTTKKGR